MIHQSAQRRRLNFDPRIKLLFVLIMGTLTFMAPNAFVLIWNYAVAVGVLLLCGYGKSAAKSAVFFAALLCLDHFNSRFVTGDTVRLTLGMLLFMVERILPLFLLAGWVSKSVRVSDLITALQNMHVPKGFTISLAVAVRFIPTVQYEFDNIKKSMKLRGIGLNFGNVFTKPVRTMEYTVVPLLLRSMKVSDELAASAMTRGLDREGLRTSAREVRLRRFDLAGALVFFACMLAGLVLNAQLQRGGVL